MDHSDSDMRKFISGSYQHISLCCVPQRRKLLQELGDQKIPFLGPSDRGFQQLVSFWPVLCICDISERFGIKIEGV